MNSKITCLGQTTVMLEMDGKTIYFDPLEVGKKADVIFYSGKVFSKDVHEKLIKKKTLVYGPGFFGEDFSVEDLNLVNPKDVFEALELIIEVIPSYKLDRLTVGSKIYNGYSVKGSESFYFAGPTDLIPEMNVIAVDCAIVPVAGECMDLFEAVASTNVIAADLFVPISYLGDEKEGLEFCVRFTRKSLGNSELFRKKTIVPEVSDLNG